MNNDAISVILPAYNEGKNIRKCVDGVASVMDKYADVSEIIIVDDGSGDETPRVLDELKGLRPRLKVASHGRRRGYGVAIRTGLQLAKNKWLLIMDSDGQYGFDSFEDFLKIRDGHSFILGYRRKREDGLHRIILARCGNLLGNLFLKQKIRDINCGFKMFRADILKDISFRSTGAAIYFEMLYRLLRTQGTFAQVPVTHYKRKKGRQTGGSPRVIVRLVWEAFTIIWHG